MHCGLEVLQKNGLLKYKESFLGFQILKALDEKTEIAKTSIPVTFIWYKSEKKFDKEFRKQMQSLGFICASTNKAIHNTIFIKQKDINAFVSEIPELEKMYIEKLPLFMENHIENKYDIIFSLVGKNEMEYYKNNYCKLKRLDIQKRNQEIKDKKEQENIEFMKLVLNGWLTWLVSKI